MAKLPAPNEPPTTSVILGTGVLATAWSIFAPCFMMPERPASTPAMRPVVSWRRAIGWRACVQGWMHCAVLDASAARTGPLLPMTAHGLPEIRAMAQYMLGPESGLKPRVSD